MVHQDSQGTRVCRAHLAHLDLRDLQRRPAPAFPSQTKIVGKTPSSLTRSMTHEEFPFQGLRGPPGLSVLLVLKVLQDLLAQQDRMGNLEPLAHRALWGRRENVAKEVL